MRLPHASGSARAIFFENSVARYRPDQWRKHFFLCAFGQTYYTGLMHQLKRAVIAVGLVLAMSHLGHAAGARSAKNYAVSGAPSQLGDGLIRELESEPHWPTLNRSSADYAKIWKNPEGYFRNYAVADHGSIEQLQNEAAELWDGMLHCNGGDLARTRQAYWNGTFCSDPQLGQKHRADLAELLASMRIFLQTTVIDPDHDKKFLDSLWYKEAVPAAPLFNQLLLEIIAANYLYLASVDKPIEMLYHERGIPRKMIPQLRDRVLVSEMAARTLLLTGRDCEDYGLWPTLSASVFSSANITYGFAMQLRLPFDAISYSVKISIANRMSCTERLIHKDHDLYLKIEERLRYYRWDAPSRGIEFYRYLEKRNRDF